MPLHSVEGVLDTDTDTQVRCEWTALADAGLPSQAGHQGTTNAPHLTLSAAGSVPDAVEARIVHALAGMQPVRVRLGALLVMGSRRFVLARLVVPTAALLALHRAVAGAMEAAPDVPERVRVDRWTPHVTLARGLAMEQVGSALAVLGTVPPLEGTLESVRRWDPDAGRTWVVGGLPTMGA
jgi:2'-5' RNA ligase